MSYCKLVLVKSFECFTMSKRETYSSLTLAKKVEVIKEVKKGVKRKCDIAKGYGFCQIPCRIIFKE